MITKENLNAFIGRKFNMLTIQSIGEPQKRTDGRNYNTIICKCDCGLIKVLKLTHVKSGHTKSCGCTRKANTIKALTTHGMSYHPLYQVYEGMMDRCYNSKCIGYCNYGARGITVCNEWGNSRSAFFTWAMANGWAKGLELDRRDNDNGYNPENCRFVTKNINLRNTRNNRTHYYNGQGRCLVEWSEVLNIPYSLLTKRMHRGWDFTKAVETPIQQITNGETLPQSKLKDTDINNIRQMLSKGIAMKIIGSIYGVSASTIFDIHHGNTWSQIPLPNEQMDIFNGLIATHHNDIQATIIESI